ncbi:MAG: exo-beta-N-acetylmuramidase NamZ domain-containing protein [Muribaculaceae bacterium]
MIKKFIFATLIALATASCGNVKVKAEFANDSAPKVKPGIEVLRDGGFEQLKGKRVGLITNPSGVDNNLKSTIDILHEAEGVELVALYGPEHGVRGDVHAGDNVDNTVDAATGVTVYSIYGKNRKPSAEMLKDVDVLVYDIQDIGCRSFTFISTMGLAMDACAELGKEFMVLDRPNPVGGNKVEGNIVEDSCFSFVSQFPIPYLYGLTPGELAQYLNEEGLLESGKKVNLTVIPMEGWTRDMKFSETGMPWVLPSPHIPTPDYAIYYPISGIVGELYCISIGVGYTMPFKLFCAEWIDANDFCKAMQDLKLPGMNFRPIHIKPFYSTGKGKNLQGVEVYVTDKEKAPLSLTNFYAMQELAKLYPDSLLFDLGDKSRYSMFDKVVGSKEIRARFCKNYRVADIEEYWNKDVQWFSEKKAKYHLYK